MQYKQIYTLITVCFLTIYTSFAQFSADSVAVVHKEWKSTKIAKGLIWKQGHFTNLFGSEQEINFVEVDLKKHRKGLRLAAEARTLRKTSEMARENKALVAVNGGFFDVKNGGAVDFIQVEGQVVNTSRKPGSRANGFFMFSRKKSEIRRSGGANYDREQKEYPNIVLSGPLLLENYAAARLVKNAFNDNRHPRTGIALTGNRKLIMLVVDGRNSKAHGMTLHELTRVFRWLGAKDAMNLDGGGSSTLYIDGVTPNGVVNHPSDNKLFDHEGERSVANMIYIKGKK